MKIFAKNFGCKTNFFDLYSILGRIKEVVGEFSIVDSIEEADLVILNSCSVTVDAEREVAKWNRRAKSFGKKVVLSGCIPNLHRVKADLVLGAGNYSIYNIRKLLKTEEGLLQKPERFFRTEYSINDDLDYFMKISDRYSRTRVYLKIQEGCSRFCSFCSIPLSRGAPRYADYNKVIEKIYELGEMGVREVVLVGTHISLYGEDGKHHRKDQKETGLGKLAKLIASHFSSSNIKIRFASLSPGEIGDDFISALESAKKIFCSHFHIPVQSGSNRVLKAMRRWHTFEDFVYDAEKLLKIFPDACIGTDIIVGFPVETDEDFEETYKNIKQMPLGHIHVFPYSKRPRTPASLLKPLPEKVVKEREEKMLSLSQEKRMNFIQQFLGKQREIIVENISDDKIFGTTDNYLNVIVELSWQDNQRSVHIKEGDLKSVLIDSVTKVGSRIFAVGRLTDRVFNPS